MNWLDYNPRLDRYYDPPDEPTHWECDRCGLVYDGSDLNHRGLDDSWLCDDCLAELSEEEQAEHK